MMTNILRVFRTGVFAVLSLGMIAPSFGDTLKIATEAFYEPFAYKAADGSLVGFDIDITYALCDAMGAECEIIEQDWDGLIPGLLAKKYDAIIASMSITPERQKVVDFAVLTIRSRPSSMPVKVRGFLIQQRAWRVRLSAYFAQRRSKSIFKNTFPMRL